MNIMRPQKPLNQLLEIVLEAIEQKASKFNR